MLTAISTVLGMIPIAPTVFWGPMAFAIMGGLLVGTILTLVFLPALYVTWFRGKEFFLRSKAGDRQLTQPRPLDRPMRGWIARRYGDQRKDED